MEDTNTEIETIDKEDLVEDTSKGLSLRDALEVAIEVHKPEGEQNANDKTTTKDSTVTEALSKQTKAQGTSNTSNILPLQPPAEWDKESKEDFLQSSPKSQEAALRLHQRRQATLEEIKRGKEELRKEAEENAWAKDVVKEITPFLKTRGDKEPTHAQVIKALKVVNEVDANTRVAVADILRAKGIPVPAELLEGEEKNIADAKIIPLQNDLNAIKMELAQERLSKQRDSLSYVWQNFESEKNAAGRLKFPDVDNTEAGLKLASSIGSLVSGQTALSNQFIANVRSRIPGADYHRVIVEAYRYLGGRVDDSLPTKTQSSKQHIIQSSRAASSVPGRGTQYVNGQVKGKAKTIREALEMSMQQLNDE